MTPEPSLANTTEFDKFFPEDFSLETSRVQLAPMREADLEQLSRITQSDSLWNYFTRELNDKQQLVLWMEEALNDRAAGKRVPFTVVEKSTGMVCGSTSFGNISFFDRRIEIGWTWLGEAFLGSGINRHCKFLLLRYAFEVMNFKRVEIKTDLLNRRAIKALRKIGAVEEGILRSHMEMPHGRRRDSIYFSILDTEWPAVKLDFFSGVI
jgi:RimJ/RimL family protein N-acetyltransferase